METPQNITRELLLDYMLDKCSAEQMQQVRNWLLDHLNDPAMDRLFNDLLNATETEFDPIGKERVRQKLATFVKNNPLTEPQKPQNRWLKVVVRLTTVAAFIAVIATAGYYKHQAGTPREWVEVYADMGQRREVILPDSSHVWLNAGSKLIYPRHFNRTLRQVYLTGEMFADIVHNTGWPFIVSADQLEVRVLGTKFNLKSYQEDVKAEVSLVKGSVSVNIRGQKMSGRLTLVPGDILRFDKTNRHIDFLNFDPKAYTNWTENDNFYFVEQTLQDIVADLHRHFNVDIIITDKSLCDETYYASFINRESLDEILKAINKDHLLNIRRENEIYYISAKH